MSIVYTDHVRPQRLLALAQDGIWHLYDPCVLAYIDQLPGFTGAVEPRWDADNPNLITFLPDADSRLHVHELDIDTGQLVVAGNLLIFNSNWNNSKVTDVDVYSIEIALNDALARSNHVTQLPDIHRLN